MKVTISQWHIVGWRKENEVGWRLKRGCGDFCIDVGVLKVDERENWRRREKKGDRR